MGTYKLYPTSVSSSSGGWTFQDDPDPQFQDWLLNPPDDGVLRAIFAGNCYSLDGGPVISLHVTRHKDEWRLRITTPTNVSQKQWKPPLGL